MLRVSCKWVFKPLVSWNWKHLHSRNQRRLWASISFPFFPSILSFPLFLWDNILQCSPEWPLLGLPGAGLVDMSCSTLPSFPFLEEIGHCSSTEDVHTGDLETLVKKASLEQLFRTSALIDFSQAFCKQLNLYQIHELSFNQTGICQQLGWENLRITCLQGRHVDQFRSSSKPKQNQCRKQAR